MFRRILIANRGEIACRVARTARRLGVRTVAVHSDADAAALHVVQCDEAVRIGPPPARDSYLRGDAIIAAAVRTGADAIHPGYGFLSENAAFAESVSRAGLVFVGPPPTAIRAMGSKAESKRLMGRAGVPLVPGYHDDNQDPAQLAGEAERVGYPVLIKASAGGGGKGMRVVESPAGFAEALASARRESAAAFGDDRVLIEKYLVRPRHVEIQVFADAHGGCVHLFERDCSVQRRHQKVLEEAPAPAMSAERRAEMGSAAVAAARVVGYVGAGTVEFIVDVDGRFYFMEMNTRLQVEHPVTEMITGHDLVEWQLRVAAGERLPCTQEELALRGHAIEARIYAEDPARDFLPSVGRILHLRQPATGREVRIDSGVRQGDAISQYYDPMLAKLIVHGATRDAALARLDVALSEFQVVGVTTNVEFLRRVVTHPAFASGEVDTSLIERHREQLLPGPLQAPPQVILAAAVAEAQTLRSRRAAEAARTAEPHSPWSRLDTWWLNVDDAALRLRFVDGEREVAAAVRTDNVPRAGDPDASDACRYDVEVDGERWPVVVRPGEAGAYSMRIGSVGSRVAVVRDGEDRVVFLAGTSTRLRLVDPLAHAGEREEVSGHLLAPMSGSVVAVLVKAGDRVEKGQALVVIEAMKMEHTIVAPVGAVVESVYFAEREQVAEGAELVSLATEG